MPEMFKESQAIAILKASKSTPKTLWRTCEKDKVVPLFSGGEVVRPSMLSPAPEADSVQRKEQGQAQARISPALLGEVEIEEEKAKRASAEERESLLRADLASELESKYGTQIAELETEIETARSTAHADGHLAGHQEGYETGLAEGEDLGLKKGKADTERNLKEQIDLFSELAKDLRAERDNILTSAKSDAIELAMRLTERLVGARLQKADHLRSRLEQALEAVSDGIGDPIYVKVAPSQVEIFKTITQRGLSQDNDLYIEPDESIEPGDLIVESCGRRVSSILKEQLERLEELIHE